jgi:hypothetical protein
MAREDERRRRRVQLLSAAAFTALFSAIRPQR